MLKVWSPVDKKEAGLPSTNRFYLINFAFKCLPTFSIHFGSFNREDFLIGEKTKGQCEVAYMWKCERWTRVEMNLTWYAMPVEFIAIEQTNMSLSDAWMGSSERLNSDILFLEYLRNDVKWMHIY